MRGRFAPPATTLLGTLAAAGALAQEPAAGLWQQDALTGDWGGLRSRLAASGISLGATEIDEVLGNATGGTRTGVAYDGRLELDLDLDLAKALDWQGGTIHVQAYQIHGRGLSGQNLGGNLLTVSNIEAARATRLFTLYLEQKLLDGRLSIRLGQIAADDEFITSSTAALFSSAAFGWPGLPSSDLPSGDPIYPLATPGIRVRIAPDPAWSWQTGLFNGNPAGGPGAEAPELRDPSGTAFSTDQGAFVISELAYTVAGDKAGGSLPASYKLGGWYHSGEFADQRLDQAGRSLADPASTGVPRRHQGDYSIYAVLDRMLWRVPGTDDHGLSAFLRLTGAPDDRNLVSLGADAGLSWKAPFPGRADDAVGLAVAVARIGDGARQLDRDVAARAGAPLPVRDGETTIELTYQFAAAPWWTLQPDLQYVIHPGGGVPDPGDPGGVTAIGDALVIGLRSSVKF